MGFKLILGNVVYREEKWRISEAEEAEEVEEQRAETELAGSLGLSR